MDITALLTALSASTDKGFANTVSGEGEAAFAQVLAAAAGESEEVSAELLSEIFPAPAREKFTALTLNTTTPDTAPETEAETAIAPKVAGDESLASAMAAALAVSHTEAPATNTASTALTTDTGKAPSAPLQSAPQIPSPAVQSETAETMAATDADTQIAKATPVKITTASADTAPERPLPAALPAADNAVSGLTPAADSGNATQPATAPVTAANTPAAAQSGTASTPPALQSPLASDAWGRELEQQLVGLAQRGDNSVELQLNPRELGPLSVNLSLDDQGAKVQFLAAQASVRTAVEQAIPQLRDALAQQGIALGEATVGEQQQQQSPERDYREGYSGGDEPAPEIASAPDATRTPTGQNGGVDLYA